MKDELQFLIKEKRFFFNKKSTNKQIAELTLKAIRSNFILSNKNKLVCFKELEGHVKYPFYVMFFLLSNHMNVIKLILKELNIEESNIDYFSKNTIKLYKMKDKQLMNKIILCENWLVYHA